VSGTDRPVLVLAGEDLASLGEPDGRTVLEVTDP